MAGPSPGDPNSATNRPNLRLPLLPTVVRWFGVLAVAATIAVYSTISTAATGDVAVLDVAISYVLHVVAYAGLALTIAYALVDAGPSWRRRALTAFALATAFGLGIELVQATTADRTPSLLDATANAAGATIVLGWYALERRCAFVPLGDWV
ncbi:hypothetical protein GCM10028857_29270 [Salinarchaeum chitinilyticum]